MVQVSQDYLGTRDLRDRRSSASLAYMFFFSTWTPWASGVWRWKGAGSPRIVIFILGFGA